jgi:hypothetical protein
MILPFIIDIKKPTDFLTRGVAGDVINDITHNIYIRQPGLRTKKHQRRMPFQHVSNTNVLMRNSI